MPTLREVRNRIIGVKKTQKITRAMKMVSAAKLRRAQTAVLAARPYAATLRKLLAHLALQTSVDDDPLMIVRPVHSVALVVVTSDRGLCGAFNTNVIKAAQQRIQEQGYGRSPKYSLFCVGKKGTEFFQKRNFPVAQGYPGVFQHVTFASAQSIAHVLIEQFRSGQVDRVEILYNEFKNAAQQRIVVDQFLPIPAEIIAKGSKVRETPYIYEPDSPAILSALLPRSLDFHLWRVLLESNASEEGARMTAMDNATENANEMIETLNLQYNKARQATITKELLEIVAGAEALTQG